jgi:hypothetical protein
MILAGGPGETAALFSLTEGSTMPRGQHYGASSGRSTCWQGIIIIGIIHIISYLTLNINVTTKFPSEVALHPPTEQWHFEA